MGKKIISYLIVFLIGGLVFGSIGTVLALTYKASDIVYSPSDTSWNVNTVGEAINSLALSKTSNNYSLEEQVVGTWIDGKPIYQKTVTMTVPISSSGTTSSTTRLDISSWNTDTRISINGFVKGYWPSTIISGYYTSLTTIDGFWLNVYFDESNELKKEICLVNHGVSNSSDAAGKTAYITLQYTKTTDSASNS